MGKLSSLIIDPVYDSEQAFAKEFDYDLLGRPMSWTSRFWKNPLMSLRYTLETYPNEILFFTILIFLVIFFIPFAIKRLQRVHHTLKLIKRLVNEVKQLDRLDKLIQEERFKMEPDMADAIAQAAIRTYTGFIGLTTGTDKRPIPLNGEEFEVVRFVLDSEWVKTKAQKRLLRHIQEQPEIKVQHTPPVREKREYEEWSKTFSELTQTNEGVRKEDKTAGAFECTRLSCTRGSESAEGEDGDSERIPTRTTKSSVECVSPSCKRKSTSLSRISGTYGVLDDRYLREMKSESDDLITKPSRRSRRPCKRRGKLSKMAIKEQTSTTDISGWTEEYKRRLEQAMEEAHSFSRGIIGGLQRKTSLPKCVLKTCGGTVQAEEDERRRRFQSVWSPTMDAICSSLQQTEGFYPSSVIPEHLAEETGHEQNKILIEKFRFEHYFRTMTGGAMPRTLMPCLSTYTDNDDSIVGVPTLPTDPTPRRRRIKRKPKRGGKLSRW
ncbi:hypothetical protein EG68_09098 [Paragonimus skrjabini miyazakii]|uniref:Uncharacterized protein n=1 Tax=Paragonimus skrjabini miyazakii TaxID=59628 RepID=A0A8S9YL93_9TREM|nr:hypothetical protein EG68_09098 [Paragonimus skrjabini miyazakii]